MVLLIIAEAVMIVCLVGVIIGTATVIFNCLPQSQLHLLHYELANYFGGVIAIFKLTCGAYIGFLCCSAYIWYLKFISGVV